jgi:hypothetical protein
LLGGWTVSGIYTARSGRPFTVTQGSLEGATWLPNLTGDPELDDPTVDRWFNPGAFTAVPAGTFGNAGRNILRGPGYITFDMSLQRRFPVGGRVGAIVRRDVFNLFNRANFGNPTGDETNITNSRAGNDLDARRRSESDAVLRPRSVLTERRSNPSSQSPSCGESICKVRLSQARNLYQEAVRMRCLLR